MMQADFVVVGGGVTGVCTAYHLARRGADVLLIERDELAPDCPISSSGEHAKAFRSMYGSDRKMTRLCMQSFQHWRQFEQESATELFVPSGMVVFGAEQAETLKHWGRPEHARFAMDSAALLKDEGLDHQLLSKAALVERYPQIAANEHYDHAIVDRTAGFFHARKAVKAIGALAEKAGAVVWQHTTVSEVVRHGHHVQHLVTDRGDVVAKHAVIFAAGTMNSGLVPELRPKTQVTQQRILHIRPQEPLRYAPSEFPIVVNINQWRYVFPMHGPGIIKVSDDDNYSPDKLIDPKQGTSLGSDDEFRSDARAFLKDYVPGLLTSQEVNSMTCRYTTTVDERYLIYRRGNAVVLSACSGHGFKNAPMTALMAATLADPETQAPSYLNEDFGYAGAPDF